LTFAACSTLTHYPDETRGLLEEFEAGSVERALAEAEKAWDKGLDRLAYLLEGGMILHGSTGGKVQERAFSLDVRPGERIFVNARSGAWDLIGFNVFQLGPRPGDG